MLKSFIKLRRRRNNYLWACHYRGTRGSPARLGLTRHGRPVWQGFLISIKTGLTDDALVRTFYFCFSITLLEGRPALFGPTLEVVHHMETQISAAWLDSAKGASGEAPYNRFMQYIDISSATNTEILIITINETWNNDNTTTGCIKNPRGHQTAVYYCTRYEVKIHEKVNHPILETNTCDWSDCLSVK